MRHSLVAITLILSVVTSASAQTTALKPELAPIGFLVGDWGSGSGKVADTGGTSTGTSTISSEVDGSVLLRRDHVDLFGANGQPTGSFDIMMMIYPEDGTLHADYSDGQHIIHYTSAVVVPGRSVVFTTATLANAPTFRLSYEMADATTLGIHFEIEPPGQTSFHLIASGTLTRSK